MSASFAMSMCDHSQHIVTTQALSYSLRIKALKTLLTTHVAYINVKDDKVTYLTHKLNLLGVELLSLSCGKVQLIPHAGNFRVLSSELGLEVGEVSVSCHALLLSPLLLRLQLSLQGLQSTQMKEAFRELSDELGVRHQVSMSYISSQGRLNDDTHLLLALSTLTLEKHT